jgi:putative ATP-binding cassette transporter
MPSPDRPWVRPAAVARAFLRSDARRPTAALAAGLLALIVANNGLNVANNLVNGRFFTALEQRQPDRVAWFAGVYLLVFAAATAGAVAARYLEERLALAWRAWVTARLADQYLAARAYYRLRADPGVDNPDQRMTDDVRSFTAATLSIALILLNSAVAFASFAGVMWAITPALLLAAVGYAALGTVLILLVGRPLVQLNDAQLRKEADLRFELIRVRENAEPIALSAGEGYEGRRLADRLAAAVANFRAVIGVNARVGAVTNGYNYLTQLIPVLIVAPLYMRGEVEFGKITQAALAFAAVLNAFSVIVTQFQQLSAYAAVANRVGAVWAAVHADPPAGGVKVTEEPDRVGAVGLTLATPGGRVLVKDLSVDLPGCRRLLVRGPNGSGRTALLRAAAGLWPWGSGAVVRPPAGRVVVLPQTPYLSPGSLREQVLYPDRTATDTAVTAALEAAGFGPALARAGGLDAEQDWAATLSLGERQQLGFARLLLAAPPLAVLDEATAALTPDQVRRLYARLAASRTCYMSLGNDPTLVPFHDLVLDLDGAGGWALRPAAEALRPEADGVADGRDQPPQGVGGQPDVGVG